jgi:tRNA-2-methylthio-N6-dimethylallyladenosine synthase
MPVLFERAGRHAGQLVGRSPYMQWVHAEADASLCGHVLEVEIRAAEANSLAGRLTAASIA